MPNLTTPNKNYLFEKFYGTRKIKEICPIFTCKNTIYKSSFSTLLYDKNSKPSKLENYRPVCQYCKNRAYRKNFSFIELNNETNNIKPYVTYFNKKHEKRSYIYLIGSSAFEIHLCSLKFSVALLLGFIATVYFLTLHS